MARRKLQPELFERNKGGRPRKTKPIRMYVAGYLHPGEDDDLIAWWQNLPSGSRFPTVIAMLRSGGAVGQAVASDTQAAARSIDQIVANFVE